MAQAFYVTDQAGLDWTTRSWEGPVGRDLTRRGRTLQYRAKESVGVRTGRLKADIALDSKTVTDGLEISVGSFNTKYALLHHTGTRAHLILPRRGKYLRFVVKGRVVFARKVNHPGTKPNLYLSRWLREAVQ